MIIFICVVIIFNSFVFTNNNFLIEDLREYSGYYYVYTNSVYNNSLSGVNIVPNYNGQVYITTINNYYNVLNNVDYISSEKIVLNNVSIKYVINKLNLTVLQEVQVNSNLKLYNCYTNKYSKSINTSNGKVNIQISVNNNTICIGYPFLVDY